MENIFEQIAQATKPVKINHEEAHKELLSLMDRKTTKGNTARTEIDFYRNNEKIGTTVLSWGKIIFTNKYI